MRQSVFLATATLVCALGVNAQQRNIDTQKSTLTIHVGKTGVFSGLGHEHVVSAPKCRRRCWGRKCSIAAPNAITGRGTASPASNAPFILDATNPDATYNLVYYVLDANTALLFDQDKGFQLTGILARQF
jgi:hypothetical protein